MDVASYLIMTVKSRMQGLEAHKYRSTIHCVTEIMKNEGIFAFYKGVGPRLTRVCLEVAITMSLYGEIVKALDVVRRSESLRCVPHLISDDILMLASSRQLVGLEDGSVKCAISK
jgi:hypothetical protein